MRVTRYGTSSYARHTRYSMQQLDLPFDDPFWGENAAIWTPRDIWVRLNQRVVEYLGEDRRYERKGCQKINLDDLATYYSTFSNTPDGGLVVFGIENSGIISGCNSLSLDQINSIETCHLTRCPQARPEFKRFPGTRSIYRGKSCKNYWRSV